MRRGCLVGCVAAVLLWTVASAQLRYSISEEVKEGTIVGNIARDLGLDKNTLKDRKYRIVSSNDDPLFYVNPNDGVLYVSRKIDREEVCVQSSACVINVKTVLETPLEVHYVEVEVLDVNDHSPTFSENSATLEISESVLPGTRFQLKAARDRDSGQFSVQRYIISNNEHFRLEVKDKRDDVKIPILVVQKSLDRETARSHSLILTALDGGKPPKSGNMNILVNVLDINDNAPIFSKEVYSVTLNENVQVGTPIIQVNATDLDDGPNGDVVYSFSNSMHQNILSIIDINSLTGQLTVKGLIDYEEQDGYEIEIQASDRGLAPLTTEKSVNIKIIDVNDNAPEIEVTSFSSSIPEDSRPGTTVALISVNDLDSGLNGKVICSVNEDVPFILSTSLKDKMFSLVTKSPLDREKQSQYELTITAKDAGQPQLSSEKTISVTVSDVNDNSPEFSLSPYTFYIHYVAVEVLDVNDHSPRFPQEEKRLEISESALPGVRIPLQPARDPDGGPFTIQQYKLSSNDHFRLEVKDKGEDGKIPILIVQKSLDREAAGTHSLALTALDGGKPAKSGEMTILIYVLDINDNAPVFSQDVYSVTLNENSPVGTVVVQVNATDLDDSQNGDIVYSFSSVVHPRLLKLFDINPVTGEITVKGQIDYEEKDKYEIEIQASDKGLAPLSTQKSVNIKIVDVNDNAPEIEVTSFSSSIPEDSRPGTTVAIISVNDLDSDSGQFSVQQYKLNHNDHFRLEVRDKGDDGKIPILVLQKALDREAAHSHSLVLTALDGGKPPKSGDMNILVNVLDVNDNTPIFSKDLYSVKLNENAPVGTEVIQVNATDPDHSQNGEVVYSFGNSVSNNVFNLFDIDQSTGKITVKGLLDYEQKDKYEIEIQASDRGLAPLTTEKSVIIKIVDVNDNAPEIEVTSFSIHYVAIEVVDLNDHSPTFPEKETTLEIFESVLPGVRIPLQPARDPDSGPFSLQQYKLSSNDHFRLEVKDSGDDGKIPVLIVQKSLDRETAGSHTLILTAMDGGKPPKSGTMNILVSVLDVNDNGPIFSKDVYTVMLHENAPVDTTVIQVNATDLDDGPNGDVVYSFSNGVNRKFFKLFDINQKTGEIIVKGLIDYEERDRYEIEIQASDKGLPPMATQKSVIIKIVDVNDNAPDIEVTSFSSSIPEDSRPGTTVALISVNDLDSGVNGKVICSVIDDVPFVLSPSLQDKMYSLVTKTTLDREKQSQYIITTLSVCVCPWSVVLLSVVLKVVSVLQAFLLEIIQK
uniref:Cadherin domain-containing protein n=1 Tax=Pundamilia nyererei TaxID=303518 RepID=A0A3B4EYB8_9CICH